MSGQPSRGYSWPPFEPGNTAAEKHGARSPRRWRPIADRLAAEIAEVAPWTARPQFAAAVASWARAEAQLQLIADYLDEHGLLDGDGVPRPCSGRLDRLEVTAANARARLGLDPLSLARLLGTLTATAVAAGDDQALEQLRAEGSRIVALREAAAIGAGSVPPAPAVPPAGIGTGDDGGKADPAVLGAYSAPPASNEDQS